MQLPDHVFLVTGACSGLGEACVGHFLAHGAKVLACDIQAEVGRAREVEWGPNCRFVAADVTSTDQIRAAIAAAVDQFGSLHGVINCAGVLGGARVVGRHGPHDLEQFTRVIHVNLIGTFNVLRQAATVMAENVPNTDGERGVIINTASVAAYEAQIGQAAYAASKGGVASMTLPIARELARLGIRVVAIAPGVFNTSMIAAAAEPVRQSLIAQTVFPPRLGEPAEYAAFAKHIVENPMLNGSVLRLDGAMRMQAQ